MRLIPKPSKKSHNTSVLDFQSLGARCEAQEKWYDPCGRQTDLHVLKDSQSRAPPFSFCFFFGFFFLHFSSIFTFLKIIKYNIPKMLLFSSILNIKMATQKSSPILFFLNEALIWQWSQYNLTKLFWMKLKTMKHYNRGNLWKKLN